MVFDSPGSTSENPKELEKKRRDHVADKHKFSHTCLQFTSTTALPNNWHGLLACHKCNKSLTHYLATEFHTLFLHMLSSNHVFTCNCERTAQSVTSNSEALPHPQLWSNADESDIQLWLHSAGTKKFIFSPDNDVYHIGLSVLPKLEGGKIILHLTQTFRGSNFLLLH